MYVGEFLEICNWCYRRIVYKFHRIMKLGKYLISKVENIFKFSSQDFYQKLKVLECAQVILNNS